MAAAGNEGAGRGVAGNIMDVTRNRFVCAMALADEDHNDV